MSHYYTKKQYTDHNPKEIIFRKGGHIYKFLSVKGVFSKGRIDPGSLLLLESSKIEEGWKVLDLGCGYGVIGILIRLFHPSVKVTMSDLNLRALQFTRKNANANRAIVEVKKSDLYQAFQGKKFNTIISNPPYSAGRKLCYKLVEESIDHLEPFGLLQVVGRHQKGGDMLAKKMKEVFGNVKIISRKAGFKVYVSEYTK